MRGWRHRQAEEARSARRLLGPRGRHGGWTQAQRLDERSGFFIPQNVEPLPPKPPESQETMQHNFPPAPSLSVSGRRCRGAAARTRVTPSETRCGNCAVSAEPPPDTAKNQAAVAVLPDVDGPPPALAGRPRPGTQTPPGLVALLIFEARNKAKNGLCWPGHFASPQTRADLGSIPELSEFPFPKRPAALMATPLGDGLE